MTTQPHLTWHFPTPIFSGLVPNFETYQQALIQLILEHKAQNLGVSRSNQNGWHSEHTMHLWQNETIVWLNQAIGEFARQALIQIDPTFNQADILLTSCWANVSEYGAWNAPHNHFPSHWSGVLYVDAEAAIDKSNPQDKNGKIEFLNPSLLSQAFNQPNGICYLPKDGMMLLFPAILQHLVHPNLSQHPRISIAFNLNLAIPSHT